MQPMWGLQDVKRGSLLLYQTFALDLLGLESNSATYLVCRQGMGVTGGTPLGFDVGAKGAGGTLPGLDLVLSAD